MDKVTIKRETIKAMMIDSMNKYVNLVLIPEGVIDETKWKDLDRGVDTVICQKKHEVAQSTLEKLKI
ncbi:MAG: hypothetical protein AAFY98_08665 [Verrucomicrobiota bacterium]